MTLRHLKTIATHTLWTLIGVYLAIAVSLKIPAIQQMAGSLASGLLAEKLGTKVTVGRVELGLFNRIVTDDVQIYDKADTLMFRLSRLAVKIDLLPLTQGKISISSSQIFGMNASLYKLTSESKPNFQFVIDSLASKDTTSKTPLDLSVNSIVIRNGSVRYDQYDKPRTPGKLNAAHLDIRDISSHIKLYSLTEDSLSVYIKKLSLKEKSGLDLNTLSFNLNADKHKAELKDFTLRLPNTDISIDKVMASYDIKNGSIDMSTVKYSASCNRSELTPSDLKFLNPALDKFNGKIAVNTDIAGTGHSVTINTLDILSTDRKLSINGNGRLEWDAPGIIWNARLKDFRITESGIEFIVNSIKKDKHTAQDIARRTGDIHFQGQLSGKKDLIACKGSIQTGAGDATVDLQVNGDNFKGEVNTKGIDARRLSGNEDFGTIVADIKAQGKAAKGMKPIPMEYITATGTIKQFDYKKHSYHNIYVDGTYHKGDVSGKLAMDDPNGKINVSGKVNITGIPTAKLIAEIQNLNPKALGLTDKTGNRSFGMTLTADIRGAKSETAEGMISVKDFKMNDGKSIQHINSITANAGYDKDHQRFLILTSDFIDAEINGKFDYNTLVHSLANVIGDKLPTLPGLPHNTSATHNNFDVDMHIRDFGWLKDILGIPLDIYSPATINATINDVNSTADLTLDAPSFAYSGNTFKDTHVNLSTMNDTLYADIKSMKTSEGKDHVQLDATFKATDNKLNSDIGVLVHGKSPLQGRLNAMTDFYKSPIGKPVAHVVIGKSELTIDKTRLDIQPSEIVYTDNTLTINDFKVSNNSQHITVNGAVTKNENDSVNIDMQNIDVEYILDLINFHSVKFSGHASGSATVRSLFGVPEANADIRVDGFRFEDGRMGTLYANVGYSTEEKQININAIADDGPLSKTFIKGYVSPARNYIDLGIDAWGTRLEFLEGFCGSFMGNVQAVGNGHCRVFGDLKTINLEGTLVANGPLDIKPLRTTYTLKNDTIVMVPDEIIFSNDTIYDIYGNRGTVNGALHHKHLTHLTYDINVYADHLLAYDWKEYGNNTFYGTVYATGTCDIKGRPGEITINVDATPQKGSFIEYNAASPEDISHAEYIKWNDVTPEDSVTEYTDTTSTVISEHSANGTVTAAIKRQPSYLFRDIPSDMKINFIINATPDFTLRVLMDKQTGDYIALNGSGGIRAYYFNKGTFEMFGNYLVDNGLYKLTIQNLIKKEFHFQQGSSITFGGDPFGAALNLKGVYTLNAVSLSDLQIGRSFKSNNIRVNCLMNIGGTAGQPAVTFDLDLPTLSTDAQQMVRSVINSEEDMNQQVLYLLAVGRFYTQGNNNAMQDTPDAPSQTSLAMQSLLSGTISQQINTVLSNVVNSSNWNFGANISTGDDGWSNAEYEGLLSGSLLNNRLLINGQFGYRDNVTTTNNSSFIGDFDIRYLLFPSGNLAIKVYNQTNDRYFTRNSLNTQGIGLIMKKDFNRLSDIFGKKKEKKKSKSKK